MQVEHIFLLYSSPISFVPISSRLFTSNPDASSRGTAQVRALHAYMIIPRQSTQRSAMNTTLISLLCFLLLAAFVLYSSFQEYVADRHFSESQLEIYSPFFFQTGASVQVGENIAPSSCLRSLTSFICSLGTHGRQRQDCQLLRFVPRVILVYTK